ncbi:MAG: hypothetical protein BWX84_01691 [Verrucomicrobia bacterium ADurb.Bin118]|nr:MAG: hypothetical protein BWX84_01691 [Verrucomicrobia bacterium ADurb.Bin118]
MQRHRGVAALRIPHEKQLTVQRHAPLGAQRPGRPQCVHARGGLRTRVMIRMQTRRSAQPQIIRQHTGIPRCGQHHAEGRFTVEVHRGRRLVGAGQRAVLITDQGTLSRAHGQRHRRCGHRARAERINGFVSQRVKLDVEFCGERGIEQFQQRRDLIGGQRAVQRTVQEFSPRRGGHRDHAIKPGRRTHRGHPGSLRHRPGLGRGRQQPKRVAPSLPRLDGVSDVVARTVPLQA